MSKLINSQLTKWIARIMETRAGADWMSDMTGPRYGLRRRFRLIAGVLALALVTPGMGTAAEHDSNALMLPSLNTAWNAGDAVEPVASPAVKADWGPGFQKNYLIPALEIPTFLGLLNGFDRTVYGTDIYGTNWNTGWHHVIHGPWTLDNDPFGMNFVMHPYMGSFNYGFARSAGLNFWESFGYTFAASYAWETFGETGPPSINDQIMTSFGGSILGECLFRMASYALEDGKPGFWRELGAAGISPSTGINRLAFGPRFKAVWVSNDPAIFTRLRLGASLTEHQTDQGIGKTIDRPEATGDFSMAYGLPGKPGYSYERPFDYFHFEFTAIARSGGNSFENIMTRGLLYGTKYSAGDAYRGIWGLYGSYDYISPTIFRVSSTALSLGTTAQWWLSHSVALQGSALGGVGFGAAGTIGGVGDPATGVRDYHYGVCPAGAAGASPHLRPGGHARSDRARVLCHRHGLRQQQRIGEDLPRERVVHRACLRPPRYRHPVRRIAPGCATMSTLPDRHQKVGTVSIAYNFLGDINFGAVEWRDFYAERR